MDSTDVMYMRIPRGMSRIWACTCKCTRIHCIPHSTSHSHICECDTSECDIAVSHSQMCIHCIPHSTSRSDVSHLADVFATHLNGTRVLSHTEVHCDSIVHAAHVMTMRQHRACNACALDVTHSSFIHVCMNESCTLYTVCTSMSHIHCILYTNHLYMTHMQWMWLTPLSYTCVWISYQHALYALRACSACNECLSCMHWCMHESALHTVLSHCNLWRMDESALHCRIVISHTYITMRQCSAWHAHIRVYYLHDIDIPRGILIYMTSCHAYEDVIYIHMYIHAWDFITCHACSALSHCTALSHSWHATV